MIHFIAPGEDAMLPGVKRAPTQVVVHPTAMHVHPAQDLQERMRSGTVSQ